MEIVTLDCKMPGLEKFSVKLIRRLFFLLQWAVEPPVCSCNCDKKPMKIPKILIAKAL